MSFSLIGKMQTINDNFEIGFNGNDNVNLSLNTLIFDNSGNGGDWYRFHIGDYVLYKSTSGAGIGGLANNTHYFIATSNSSQVSLSLTSDLEVINIFAVGSDDLNHSLTLVATPMRYNEKIRITNVDSATSLIKLYQSNGFNYASFTVANSTVYEAITIVKTPNQLIGATGGEVYATPVRTYQGE
jgi:hypothetical protein